MDFALARWCSKTLQTVSRILPVASEVCTICICKHRALSILCHRLLWSPSSTNAPRVPCGIAWSQPTVWESSLGQRTTSLSPQFHSPLSHFFCFSCRSWWKTLGSKKQINSSLCFYFTQFYLISESSIHFLLSSYHNHNIFIWGQREMWKNHGSWLKSDWCLCPEQTFQTSPPPGWLGPWALAPPPAPPTQVHKLPTGILTALEVPLKAHNKWFPFSLL